MPNVERLSITLPADLARLIRTEVAEGRFASDSDVVGAAMRAWQDREHRRAALIARIDAADNDPRPSLTDDDVDAHFEARFRTASEDHA
ncbi:type II toxin-antitoxin system ParD family antitoxin [uncultured Methylobacterium sp.]|uniref:ribbon-helix-helix domain-containing protein n=1 Tax=uncultured Methylobacterium sp. TaxID=157278 RepID=UPI0035CB7489